MPTPVRVLLVEDDPADAELAELQLRRYGFSPTVTRVEIEPDFVQGLAEAPDVIVADWRLPRFSGRRALHLARERAPGIPFIILSGSIGEVAAVEVLRDGARDYVLKDRPARLGAAVEQALGDARHSADQRRALERMEVQTAALQAAANGVVITNGQGEIEWVNGAFSELTGFSAQEALGRNPRELMKSGAHPADFYRSMWDTILAGRVWHGEVVNCRRDGSMYDEEQTITPVYDRQGHLTHFIAIKQDVTERKRRADELAALHEETQRRALDLELAYETTIEGWSRALDLRDKETEGHTQRVTDVTMRLARAAGMPELDLIHLRRGALLHDIGKMGIPDGILLKPGKLTDEELVIMRRHPQYARELLWPIEFLRPALDVPFSHHEKWDGTGYPQGLAGDAIPFAARLFSVVDVWDALRSNRPYRAGWPEEKVLAYLRECAGTHFDPRVVDAFFAEIATTSGPPSPPAQMTGASRSARTGRPQPLCCASQIMSP